MSAVIEDTIVEDAEKALKRTLTDAELRFVDLMREIIEENDTATYAAECDNIEYQGDLGKEMAVNQIILDLAGKYLW